MDISYSLRKCEVSQVIHQSRFNVKFKKKYLFQVFFFFQVLGLETLQENQYSFFFYAFIEGNLEKKIYIKHKNTNNYTTASTSDMYCGIWHWPLSNFKTTYSGDTNILPIIQQCIPTATKLLHQSNTVTPLIRIYLKKKMQMWTVAQLQECSMQQC